MRINSKGIENLSHGIELGLPLRTGVGIGLLVGIYLLLTIWFTPDPSWWVDVGLLVFGVSVAILFLTCNREKKKALILCGRIDEKFNLGICGVPLWEIASKNFADEIFLAFGSLLAARRPDLIYQGVRTVKDYRSLLLYLANYEELTKPPQEARPENLEVWSRRWVESRTSSS